MAITERLYQFDAKATSDPNDIIYVGNSVDSFNEVRITVSGIVAAYPNLLAAAEEGDVTFNSVAFSSTKEMIGTATNDNADAGSVGEVNSTIVVSGSAVSLTTATPANIATLVLQPGDYDVWAELWTLPDTTTTTQSIVCGLNTTSATIPTVPSLGTAKSSFNTSLSAGVDAQIPINACRISVATATTTTVYLVANIAFSVSTMGGFGKIVARRRR